MRHLLKVLVLLGMTCLAQACNADADSPGPTDDGAKPDVPGPCQPACQGKICGPNGCGGVCGVCSIGQSCTSEGQCVCLDAGHAECRDGDVWWIDACGASSVREDCVAGCADAACIPPCVPTCVDRECGDDGCGGNCGDCIEPEACWEHQCTCAPQASKECGDGDVWWFDSCGFPGEKAASCNGEGCDQGHCLNCTPDCTDRECGDDGCGDSCGSCPGGATQCTDAGQCDCDAYCVGKECGDDGCGGSCGTCPGGGGKCLNFKCTCIKSCVGKECGDDGCGGDCGTCTDGACQEGQCAAGIGPRIVTFSSNTQTLSEGATMTLTVVATHADGVANLAGGTVGDAGGGTYGALSASGPAGTYRLTLSWDQVHAVLPINTEPAGSPRTFRARVSDQAGNTATKDLSITLRCASSGYAACDGTCIDVRDDFDNCGGCDFSCVEWGESHVGHPFVTSCQSSQCAFRWKALSGESCNDACGDDGETCDAAATWTEWSSACGGPGAGCAEYKLGDSTLYRPAPACTTVPPNPYTDGSGKKWALRYLICACK